MRDRNGNQLTFTYETYGRVSKITDSLNREVTVEYDVTDVYEYDYGSRVGFWRALASADWMQLYDG